MKKFPFLLFYCCFFLLALPALKAQQGPVASGGESLGFQGFASFSIGQIDYLTNTGTEEIISTEGIQQPYEILLLDNDGSGMNADISIYQNLTSDFVILNIQNVDIENMHYGLYDLQGKLIEEHKITNDKTSISFTDQANAIYFIKIYLNEKQIRTFKIIKN